MTDEPEPQEHAQPEYSDRNSRVSSDKPLADLGAWLILGSLCYIPFYIIGTWLEVAGMMTFLYTLCLIGLLLMSLDNAV